jgi:ribosomal protein S18 acetylase RimI-like enzyme
MAKPLRQQKRVSLHELLLPQVSTSPKLYIIKSSFLSKNISINMQEYLQNSEIIDWQNPEILKLAKQLASKHQTTADIAKASFEWVRDRIHHSYDDRMNPVTCRASDVLKYRTGYCFAKSHLLAALLRANQIPAGLCYQRLSIDDLGAPYSLHGFNAIFLPEIGWYRVDPRGNRDDINAQFSPPHEQLAYKIKLPQEADFENIFPEPLPIVVNVLQEFTRWEEVWHFLPDISVEMWQNYRLILKMKNYQIRALTHTDESMLWTMLMYAAHESSIATVQTHPDLFKYVKDWGRNGDLGFVAIDSNLSNESYIGAAWLRLFSTENRGFGYINDDIPELAIAVLPEYQGQGIGTKLLGQIIDVAGSLYPAISLSVRDNNPAIDLYQRLGFVKIENQEFVNRTGGISLNMIYKYL